jgi:tetratricopeptide (TPR) repeat protein
MPEKLTLNPRTPAADARRRSPSPRGRRFALATAAALLIGLTLRLAWPLADPADRLSWSNGVYTDPAATSHAARNAVLFGEWIRDESRDLVFFSLHNAITWIAFRLFGVSRLTTQILSGLLGTLAVAAIAWGAGRCRGAQAALITAVLGAGCAWLALFARIPVTENLVAALLGLAAGLALDRRERSAAAAGFIAGVAILFGKANAAPFLLALLLFRAMRAGRARALLAPILAFAVAGALWGIIIFLPFRADILDQLRRAPTLYGETSLLHNPGERAAELLRTLRTSWLFYRIPILGPLGAVFLVWTVGHGEIRRRRLENGSALFVLWFLAGWLYFSLLPYKAPRYFLLVVPAFVGAAALALTELWETPSLKIRPPHGWPGHLRLGITLYLILFTTLDSLRHDLGILADAFRTPGGALRERLVQTLDAAVAPLHHLGIVAGAALVLAVGATVAFSRATMAAARPDGAASLPARLARVPPRRLAAVLLAAILCVNLGQYFAWTGRRVYGIEEAKASLDAILGEDAVLLGAFAPVLVQDSRRTAVFQYAGPDTRALAQHDVTHVVLSRPGELDVFTRAYPELIERMPTLAEWPLRASHVRGLRLLGFPFTAHPETAAEYEPTLFEQGVDALEAGDPAAALRLLEEFDRNAPRNIPDGPAMAARALYGLGDAAGALRLMKEAIRRRPTDSADYFNLGNLLLRQGDASGAQAAWRRGLDLDPYDEDMREAYSSSIQNSQAQ